MADWSTLSVVAALALAGGAAFGRLTGYRAGHELGYQNGRLAELADARRRAVTDPHLLGVAEPEAKDSEVVIEFDALGRACAVFGYSGGINLIRLSPRARAAIGRTLTDSNVPKKAGRK